jgi:TonB family protein
VSVPAADSSEGPRGVRPNSDFLTLTRNVVALPRRGGSARPYALPEWVTLADDLPSPPDERDDPALDEDETSLPDDRRYEPALAATPYLIEFDEIDRLDPDRAGTPTESPPDSTLQRPVRGPIGSLLIHLLVLALLLAPGFTVPDLPKPIPIQLVLETPPPPPPVPAQMPAPPPEPHGRLASEDIGDTNAKSGQAPDRDAAETAAKPAPAPAPAPTLVPPPPPEKPPPPKDQVALADPTVPPPLLDSHPRFSVPPAAHPSEETHIAAHPGKVPGPAATRDEYLAYLVSMTKQHFDLLPMSVIGGRTGETSLAVLVLADGTIARISIAEGSGNSDIDNRIEQMVAACRRFPPLPQWYQGQSMELIFKLHYPEALEERR